MGNTYPLQRNGPTQYTGKSPSAVTDESEKYKSMLGTLAASEDVGLFYQLNAAAPETAQTLDQKAAQGPIEAGGMYA